MPKATESNSMPHSNLRLESSSGYRWPSSVPAADSTLAGDGVGVAVGGTSVGGTVAVAVAGASVGVTVGSGVSLGIRVAVGASVGTAVGSGTGVSVGAGMVGVAVAVSFGGDWNNPEIALRSVCHNTKVTSSEANIQGLNLSTARISRRIRLTISQFFISQVVRSFPNLSRQRRVL